MKNFFLIVSVIFFSSYTFAESAYKGLPELPKVDSKYMRSLTFSRVARVGGYDYFLADMKEGKDPRARLNFSCMNGADSRWRGSLLVADLNERSWNSEKYTKLIFNRFSSTEACEGFVSTLAPLNASYSVPFTINQYTDQRGEILIDGKPIDYTLEDYQI